MFDFPTLEAYNEYYTKRVDRIREKKLNASLSKHRKRKVYRNNPWIE
jgi:hypothetical protein